MRTRDHHPPQVGMIFSTSACQPIQGSPLVAVNGEHATLRGNSLASVTRRNGQRQLPLQFLSGEKRGVLLSSRVVRWEEHILSEGLTI